MANKILRQLAEANEEKENEKSTVLADVDDGKLKAFRFDNKLYYYAVRDDVLIFDHHKELFYTVSIEDLRASEHPFFQKVYSLVCNITSDTVKLFIKRNGIHESISFTRKFDAVFIFKKLRRVASREVENIDEILLEKNGVLIDSFTANEKKQKFYSNFKGLKNRVVNRQNKMINIENSPEVSTLVKIEDTVDSLIASTLTKDDINISNEKIDKCISMLNSLKK